LGGEKLALGGPVKLEEKGRKGDRRGGGERRYIGRDIAVARSNWGMKNNGIKGKRLSEESPAKGGQAGKGERILLEKNQSHAGNIPVPAQKTGRGGGDDSGGGGDVSEKEKKRSCEGS